VTPNDIIARSLRMLGVLGQGNPVPTPYQSQVMLIALNGMMSALSRKRLIVPARWYFTFPLTSGQQKYTMGATVAGQSGGTPNFCTATEAANQVVLRPIRIERAGVILPNSPPGQPFELPMTVWTDDQWASESLKKLTGTQIFPMAVWPDNAQNPYIQNLWMWPVPQAACSISLYVWQPFGQIVGNTALISQIYLPDDYDDLLCSNLAVRAASEMSKEPSDVVTAMAADTLRDMRTSNLQPIFLRCPDGIALNLYPGVGGAAYNFRTDGY
jgi:hypothetical protein